MCQEQEVILCFSTKIYSEPQKVEKVINYNTQIQSYLLFPFRVIELEQVMT
jgi:hypothetical protein